MVTFIVDITTSYDVVMISIRHYEYYMRLKEVMLGQYQTPDDEYLQNN